MTAHNGEVLAWIDVETTGLRAQDHYLLEVACIVTDTLLRPLAEPFHRVVRYDRYDVPTMKDRTSDYVVDMHTKTGLWEKLPAGTERMDVDRQLRKYIKSVAPNPKQARVAGNSVRLDLNFLEEWLPETYEHLHYRFVDVSGLEFILREWELLDKPTVKGEPAHTAVEDIAASVVQLHAVLDELEHTKQQRDQEFGA